MIILKGKAVAGGVAFGKINFYIKEEQQVSCYKVEDPEQEFGRFQDAKEKAIRQLNDLYEMAIKEVGEENAEIFQVHQMMLEDLEFCDAIEGTIKNQFMNAEFAVKSIGDSFAKRFSSMEDEYFQARGADIQDVSQRLIQILHNKTDRNVKIVEPCILAAEDLAPSETVQLDKLKVLAFLTKEGSINSHTSILARTMNIPAIVAMGEELKEEYDGLEVIVDGGSGNVYIDPDEATIHELKVKQNQEQEKNKSLESLKGKESITLCGRKIKLFANIGNASDVEMVIQNDGEGIGLFRSEFLYLESSTYPTEEQQFQVYRTVAENMAGKKVIVRTLDIGADKQVDYFNLPKEANPAMGYRAIRICLTQKDIFKTQLRALLRASFYGNISIMFPMIISVEEVLEIKEFVEIVKTELREEGISFNEQIELGIMIETPAAVMISDLLAEEVDFFSIGTNDLTQYTLAIDRQNPKLDKFYNAKHRAILRMIQLIVNSGHNKGIWVGICGELGSDLELIETFLKMGIDELSVSPSMILPIRKKIREME